MPCRSSPRPTCRPARRPLLAGETHEGPDYAGFPGIPRGRYPKGDLIRIVLGDVSARTPAKARCYCRTSRVASGSCPRPSCGFRPDLVEGLFSRKARRTLRGIRVFSKDESEERILRHLEEADAEPVACRRRWGLSDMGPTTEELVVDALLSDGADKAG